ncbi:hypothetical protein CDAR_34761 [Caerostris darwini]|uniref:Ribosomal protein S16 n=1 Tax=Caerostris darwini TaxID=1538125 RepID=A0AAV4RZF8_9ARAC|nr:hypothetical protein CDAR_34761 [Caerostris darwini]
MAVTYVTAPLPGDSLQKRSTNIPPQLKLILVKGRLGKSSFEDIERVFRNQSLVGVDDELRVKSFGRRGW